MSSAPPSTAKSTSAAAGATTIGGLLSRISRASEWIASHCGLVLLFILFIAAVRSTLLAISKPFWYDELCTVLVTRLPNASAIWQALAHGADGQPPAFYLMEKFTRSLVGHDHIGYRLLSILGVLVTILCAYLIVSKRVSRLSALIGASFLLCTILMEYAAEARPYAIWVGCFALAILAWQRIDDSQFYALAMAVCLAAAASVHYYAVIVWPVFVLGEAAVLVFRHRFRWSAWLAIALGATPMLLLAPLLLRFRQYYGGHFLAQPSIENLIYAHDQLFSVSGHWGLGLALGLSAILLYKAATRSGERGGTEKQGKAETTLPIEDLTLSLALLWLPIIAVIATKVAHGGLNERYMLPAVLGGAMALGFAIDAVRVVGRVLLLLLLVLQYASPALTQLKSAIHGTLRDQRASAAGEVSEFANHSGFPGLPVVMADAFWYLPRYYYSPPPVRSKLFSIADSEAALTYSETHSDTVDLQVLVFRNLSLLPVESYADFLKANPQFLLVSDKVGRGTEWLPARLQHDGATIQVVSTGDTVLIYKVTLNH